MSVDPDSQASLESVSSAELTNTWTPVSSYGRQSKRGEWAPLLNSAGRDWHDLSCGRAAWGFLDTHLWVVPTVSTPEGTAAWSSLMPKCVPWQLSHFQTLLSGSV